MSDYHHYKLIKLIMTNDCQYFYKIKKLIEKYTIIDKQDQYGNTPLMIAIEYNNKYIFDLLSSHSNLNIQNNQGNTALITYIYKLKDPLFCLNMDKRLLKSNIDIQNNFLFIN